MNVKDHSITTLSLPEYGVIHDHCTIRLECEGQDVHVNRVCDHTIITGNCRSLTVGHMEDHCKVCVTGHAEVGNRKDHCDVLSQKPDNLMRMYRTMNERPGNPGL